MSLMDFISILALICLLVTLRKAYQQAAQSDREEAIHDFVKDTLDKAATDGEREWRDWYPNGIKPTRAHLEEDNPL